MVKASIPIVAQNKIGNASVIINDILGKESQFNPSKGSVLEISLEDVDDA